MARRKDTYARKLKDARARHDARFKVDNPPPTMESVAASSVHLEGLVAWLVVLLWIVLAVAGTGMSYPHTIKTLEATVDVGKYPWFPTVAFVGIELGAVMIAFAAALKSSKLGERTRKIASLRGGMRWLVMRIGINPDRWDALSLDHLPDRESSTGGVLALASLFAMMVFNLRDTLGLPWLGSLSQTVAGLAGPVLVYAAGHRFAHEIVKASARGQAQRLEAVKRAYAQRMDRAWQETSARWLQESGIVEPEMRGGKPENGNRKTGTGALQPEVIPENSNGRTGSPGPEPEIAAPRSGVEVEEIPGLVGLAPKTRSQVQGCAMFYGSNPGATLSELAEHLGVSTSRAGEIRRDAVECGALEKVENRKFVPAGMVLSLA